MSEKYPHPCCQCGFCCLCETCPTGQLFYNIEKTEPCPALSFDEDGIANCALAEEGLIPLGDGCCMKARCVKDNIAYDFSAMPKDIKYRMVELTRSKQIPVFMKGAA